jgi:hypothetical protein
MGAREEIRSALKAPLGLSAVYHRRKAEEWKPHQVTEVDKNELEKLLVFLHKSRCKEDLLELLQRLSDWTQKKKDGELQWVYEGSTRSEVYEPTCPFAKRSSDKYRAIYEVLQQLVKKLIAEGYESTEKLLRALAWTRRLVELDEAARQEILELIEGG